MREAEPSAYPSSVSGRGNEFHAPRPHFMTRVTFAQFEISEIFLFAQKNSKNYLNDPDLPCNKVWSYDWTWRPSLG